MILETAHRRPKLILASIFVLALLVRLAPLLNNGSSWAVVGYDSSRYVEAAEGLRLGCGYARYIGRACTTPEVRRPPGYSVFLALMPSLRTAIALQAMMGALICILIGVVMRLYWSPEVGLFAALLLAIDICSATAGDALMSEALFQLMLVAGVCLILYIVAAPWRPYTTISLTILSGAFLGLAALVRPVGVLLPTVAGVPFLLDAKIAWSKRAALALIVVVVSSVIISAWIERNVRCCNVHTIATTGAIDFYYWKAAGILAYSSNESIAQATQDLEAALPPGTNADSIPDELSRRSWKIILSHPEASFIVTTKYFLYLLVVPAGSFLSGMLGLEWQAPQAGNGDSFEKLPSTLRRLIESPIMTFLIIYQIALALFILFGIARAVLSYRSFRFEEQLALGFLLCVSLLLLGIAAGADTKFRNRMPVAPFLSMIASAGWFTPRRLFDPKSQRTRSAARETVELKGQTVGSKLNF
jgi:4-amino-4-deoxy-L-arabinose transferase-like glycosyltransferase